jgi:hypothetical protein
MPIDCKTGKKIDHNKVFSCKECTYGMVIPRPERTFEKSLSISETPILSLKGSVRKPYFLVTTNPFQTSSQENPSFKRMIKGHNIFISLQHFEALVKDNN